MDIQPGTSGFDTIKQKLPSDQLFNFLNSSPNGLSSEEAASRLEQYGTNTLAEGKKKPLIIKLLSQFTHLMAIMLWVAGIGAFIAQMPQLGIAVWSINVINGIFSFWQEFQAEKATDALKMILPSYTRVLRDGEQKRILATEVVPGDIVFLEEGESISADSRLLTSAELRVNQSTLTGESRPVNRSADPVSGEGLTESEMPNLVFAGTFVASGSGKAIVYATGMKTAFGRIARLTQEVSDDLSPLQKEMQSVTKVVTVIAVSVGVSFFVLAKLFTNISWIDGMIFALGIVVAFVPEGLEPTVTLALAMATQRMAKRNALMKKLSAVETLGCTTVICTDKTGTLTQNEMTVHKLWVPSLNMGVLEGREISFGGVGYEPVGAVTENGQPLDIRSDQSAAQVLLTQAKCNTSRLNPPSIDEEGNPTRWSIIGDPTEAALIVAAQKAGLRKEEIDGQVMAEQPFDSHRKRMSIVHLTRSEDGFKRVVYTKGGIRETLDVCNTILIDGQVQPLTQEQITQIMSINDAYAVQGLRVLAASQRALDDKEQDFSIEALENGQTFLGMVAMMDPPRPDVAKAVETCHHAGIRIIMITGDYGLTAESIARKIGIVTSDNTRVVTGVELEGMSEDVLKQVVTGEVIFARVAPEHKLRVVSALQSLGQVVAVTGDGVNDAPALKKADIGIAMGISGSDVAKEAADMILTDDNFGSIVSAIEEGRAVYENIKRFTSYIFTSNTPEAVPFMLFALSAGRIPVALPVMHVLAVDLGTDMVPALGLGAEPPEEGVMDLPPRKLSDHLITKELLTRAYLVLGPVQSVVAMLAFYFYYWTNGYPGQWLDLPGTGDIYLAATAMALAGVVVTQIGNVFTQRAGNRSILKLPLFSNKLVWIGILFEILLVLGITYVPFLQKFIGTAGFDPKYWLFLALFIPALPITDAIYKVFKRRRRTIVTQTH
ncbi:MAG: cation-transporting P-type ATPase [Anaerolineaceae bacterium]|nr:cation-transporting P-type ATPase [Anaerolineaceae bacterium]MDD4043687.1 cation-transporting P-type ATPase [Anaerolineaceae bacterium]MDD4578060.1 cation-transporting P-type ATPase [Anaerolineaceae bacterium]